MHAHQMRPALPGGAQLSDEQSGFIVMPLNKAMMEPKRVTRDDRIQRRFGPLPGEVFQDEAKFGSFN